MRSDFFRSLFSRALSKHRLTVEFFRNNRRSFDSLRYAPVAQDDNSEKRIFGKNQRTGFHPRSRKLFDSTQTELAAMAAAAIHGESRMWKAG